MTSRRRVDPSMTMLLVVVLSFVLLPGIHPAHAVTSSNLSVASSGNVLAASRNNTLTMEISNVGKYVKELDVALTIAPPLVLFGDNHWIRSWFAPGDVIRVNLTIFAPSSAAGTTSQGSVVAVYKVVGETTPSSETHAISFLVSESVDRFPKQANLSVASSGNVLVASRNNTLVLQISNIGNYLGGLDVALTIPPPLVLFADNHWIRSSFAHGDVIRVNLTIFAPSSAAGATLQGSIVAVYKIAGETVPSTEAHAISFLVRGWIDIKVYEITVSPDPALPGAAITIYGNLLNRGVIAAMYTNVTVAPAQPFVKGSVKPTYVGQVDPNAPAPFSVTALVDSGAREGKYQATILVYYRDDLQLDDTVTIPIDFAVVSALPKTETATTSITHQLATNEVLLIGLAVVIGLVIVGIYLRRRRKAPET